MTNTRKPPRKGVLIFAVLACLMVAMSITLGAVHTTLRHRRQLQTDMRMEQTQWLLDQGVRVAIHRYRQQDAYQGETVQIQSAIGRRNSGTVTIEVFQADQPAKSVGLRITASLDLTTASQPSGSPPAGTVRRTTLQRTAEVFVPEKPSA